jgi:hypothetical protein
MPAEIVNLRRVRKSRARIEKDAAAAENRSRHGRTRAEKDIAVTGPTTSRRAVP